MSDSTELIYSPKKSSSPKKCMTQKQAGKRCAYRGVIDTKTNKKRQCKNYVTKQISRGCYVCDCHVPFAGGAAKK
jgi:hypothetical protein